MKIILMITGLGMGGAERQVCDLSDQFTSLGHEVMICYLTGDAIIRPKSRCIRLIKIGMSKSPTSFFKAYLKLRYIIAEFDPDVVHTHMIHANLMGRFLRLTTSIKRLICTAHNTNEGGILRMFLYRTTDPLCDISTNVSQEAVEAFIAKRAVTRKKMILVYNGIDTQKFRFNSISRQQIRDEFGFEDYHSLILCIGRLQLQKDYPTMLKAFALSESRNENLYLWIVGNGEEKESLIHLCQKLNIYHKVRFLGIRHDIPELMSACDLFCLSSIYEGLPLVISEALSCERHVVATNCGGVKEIVAENGILVPTSSPEKLADAILHALQYPSISARDRIIQMFSLDSITQQWIDLYTTQNLSEKTK